MSALKRSNSSSNIPRLSRLPVRGSTSTRPRSTSARSSYTHTNLLTIFGGGTMGRSSSYSNLSTPCQKLVPLTPSSGASSASKDLRMNQGEWQKMQFMRVKKFFAEYDSEMPPLKPLSIRAYIHSMNILFKQVDNRINITMENYKDSVPDYLTSFKYPYKIKASVTKSPAVPSSWQFILQIWIWLIDLIELLKNPEKILLPQTMDQTPHKLFYACTNYMADRFMAYNKEHDENAIDNLFRESLAHMYHIDFNDAKTSEDENRLDEKLICLNEMEESTKMSIQEITQKLSEVRKSNATRIQNMYRPRDELLHKLKEMRIKSRNLQLEYNKTLSRKDHLETVIAAQPCTKAESNQIRQKLQDTLNVEELKQQCLTEQNQAIDKYSLEINQNKYAIKSMIHKTNDKIAVLSCKAPELHKLRMPVNLDSSRFEKDLEDFGATIKKIDSDLRPQLDTWKAAYKKKELEHRMVILGNEEFDVELEKVSKLEKEQLESQNKQRNALCEQIRAIQVKIGKKKNELAQYSRPNLDGIKHEYEASIETLQNLKRLQQETIKKADTLFTNLHKSFKDTINQQMTMMEGIDAAIEESFKE